MRRTYHFYILASASRVLYLGVSGSLSARIHKHPDAQNGGFTGRYRVHRLVYVEACDSALAAIAREKQVKGWRHSKNLLLIEHANPEWNDLAGE